TSFLVSLFIFNAPLTFVMYTLSLHDALPIFMEMSHRSKVYDKIIKDAEADLRELMNIPDNYKVLFLQGGASQQFAMIPMNLMKKDRKSTRLNSSHVSISYAVFCLKKKKNNII